MVVNGTSGNNGILTISGSTMEHFYGLLRIIHGISMGLYIYNDNINGIFANHFLF